MHLLLALIVAGLVAGCGSAAPTATAAADIPLACMGVAVTDCRALASQAVEGLSQSERPSYIEVRPVVCDEPCTLGSVEGVLTVEYLGIRPPDSFRFIAGSQGTTITATESVRTRVEPASQPLPAPVQEFSLGHCGLGSGIDVDGSFWDPVGEIDPAHPDVINAAAATFTRTTPDTALLRTEGGLEIQLVRHRGPKTLPGCD